MRISQWKKKVIFTIGYLGIVALLYKLGITCIFKEFLGFACPGCGMTRATLAAMRLNFAVAFHYHPMFWSMPLLYLYFLSDNGLFPDKRWDRVLLIGIGGGFFINWLTKLW